MTVMCADGMVLEHFVPIAKFKRRLTILHCDLQYRDITLKTAIVDLACVTSTFTLRERER